MTCLLIDAALGVPKYRKLLGAVLAALSFPMRSKKMEKQRSNAWFEKRKGRVTGSNVGAILGLNKYKTADDVLREMVRAWHGAEREFEGNQATEWGTFNEDGAIAEYQMETGNKVEECGFFVHPEHEWLGASPDGLIGADGTVEIKCPYGKRDSADFKPLDDQPHYAAQVQIEMACTGRTWCHFYQWSPKGTKLERVEIDPLFLEWAIPELRRFHDRFLSEIDNPEHLQPKRKQINSAIAEKLVQEYDELTEALERASQRKKEILDTLVLLAKERDAEICGKKLTKVERKGSIDYKRIPELAGVNLEQYRKASSSYWRLS
jgi:putative phage-type endonuclease